MTVLAELVKLAIADDVTMQDLATEISKAIIARGADQITKTGLNECVIAQDSKYTLTVQKRVN